MSGPIVRKYGFPNFEKIFGERKVEHGIEGDEAPAGTAETPETRAVTPDDPSRRVIPGQVEGSTSFGNAVE